MRLNRKRKHFLLRYQMPLITALTSSLIMGWASAARAAIFDPLRTSVQCIATAASTGGGGSTLLTQMPGLLVAGIGIAIFIGCVVVGIRYLVDSSRGEDTREQREKVRSHKKRSGEPNNLSAQSPSIEFQTGI